MNGALGIDPVGTTGESEDLPQRDVDLHHDSEVAEEIREYYPSTINDWSNNWYTAPHGECKECARKLTPNTIFWQEDGKWPNHVCTLCGNTIECNHEGGHALLWVSYPWNETVPSLHPHRNLWGVIQQFSLQIGWTGNSPNDELQGHRRRTSRRWKPCQQGRTDLRIYLQPGLSRSDPRAIHTASQ